ncbi:3-hydroxybutyryl-CoA dehydrogenase [Alcaligenes faecalis]|uniref:3-hydroxybutyryl-CoA dehydrogenase n=1 Tax=Alcaligenes faecalis TaxID=511 RepID=UPI000A2D615F|nr:3-hydroxybutyryl-CoA dehydrogenase [Alcaligenes faecalis]KAA1287079.1 3-hydroxybutyryl-CoA dehydrogenase [Alcaligenes faecalis]OSZ32173.1 3-hydroxybutyryl-CoA dehydrogenase [Alcaligenes faecalis]OSZ40224.1 3-hydroxybutyryl-CoA dehydrogenase [Alcaligenes faecalis]
MNAPAPIKRIVAVGAGRMGRGIALAYALRGQAVTLLDFKPRQPADSARLEAEIRQELRATLEQLADLGMFAAEQIDGYLACISVAPLSEAAHVLGLADLIYEGVPETREAKTDALGRIGELAQPDALIASTTSTMLASDLAPMLSHPERFLNAHWLNPAFLIPLVEISAHPGTSEQTLSRLQSNLESIGKVPVVCGCHPGFIVPRLQTLIMNEAARMVEEGVASAADIDKATRYGLGFRFASIGVLEFIDYGGNDILYHAGQYLSQNLDPERYAVPDIITRYMESGRNGLRSGQGFHEYPADQQQAYRRDVLARVLGMLDHIGLAPARAENLAKETQE